MLLCPEVHFLLDITSLYILMWMFTYSSFTPQVTLFLLTVTVGVGVMIRAEYIHLHFAQSTLKASHSDIHIHLCTHPHTIGGCCRARHCQAYWEHFNRMTDRARIWTADPSVTGRSALPSQLAGVVQWTESSPYMKVTHNKASGLSRATGRGVKRTRILPLSDSSVVLTVISVIDK